MFLDCNDYIYILLSGYCSFRSIEEFTLSFERNILGFEVCENLSRTCGVLFCIRRVILSRRVAID